MQNLVTLPEGTLNRVEGFDGDFSEEVVRGREDFERSSLKQRFGKILQMIPRYIYELKVTLTAEEARVQIGQLVGAEVNLEESFGEIWVIQLDRSAVTNRLEASGGHEGRRLDDLEAVGAEVDGVESP